MTAVRMEVQRADGEWATIGEASDPPGSFSSNEESGRQVYIFGLMGGAPGVWRSTAGFDLEDPKLREIHTAGLECLSELPGPFELTIVRKSGGLVNIRFRVIGIVGGPEEWDWCEDPLCPRQREGQHVH